MGFSDEREYEFAIERFTGIDQGMEGNDTPMHCSRDAENCDTSGGVLRLAAGWAPDAAVGTAHDNIKSLMHLHKHNPDGSVTTKLVAGTDTGLRWWNEASGENGAWDNIAGSCPVTSGRFSHVNYQKKDKALLILANGTDNVYSWTGEGMVEKLAKDAEWIQGQPIADIEKNCIRLTNHGLAAGNAVAFYANKGALPGGLAAYDTYFVKSLGADWIAVGTRKSYSTLANIKTKGTVGWCMAKIVWLGASIPTASATTNVITLTSHGLAQNEAIVFDPWDGSLPEGIDANKAYYSYIIDANKFMITSSADNIDDAVDITSSGSNFRIRRNDPQKTIVTGAPSASKDSDIISFTGHKLANDNTVEFSLGDGGIIPDGLTAHDGTDQGKYYYVVKATPNTFRVSDTKGGEAIALNSAGKNFKVRLSRENRPAGGSLALHAERVWCAGEKSRANSAFYSDDMDPTNWAIGTESAGEINKPTWDGDAVTAVANLFDNIVVFKSRSMFRVAGSSPGEYQIAPVLSTTGTLSPFTICQWQNAAFFLSPMGIMAFDGVKCDRLGGNALKDFWARLNTAPAALAGACAVVHGGHLLTALPMDDSQLNNCVVDFDISAGAFMLRTGIQVDCWLQGDELRFASGKNVNFWGKAIADRKVYGTGEGCAISMSWETPESDFGSRNAVKTITTVAVTGSGKALDDTYQGGKISITVKADGKACEKTMTLPAATGTAKASFHISGRRISIALANVEGSNIEVSGVTVMYEREDE